MVSWGKVTKNSHEIKWHPSNHTTSNTLRKNIKIIILKQLQVFSELQKLGEDPQAGFTEI